MTRIEAMAAIAQIAINVAEHADPKSRERAAKKFGEAEAANLNRIEKGSRSYRGIEEVCAREVKDVERLKAIEACLRDGFSRRSVEAARKLVGAMIAERTDPEFEPDDLESTRGEGA